MTLIAVLIISLFILVFFISKNRANQLVKKHEAEVRAIQLDQSAAQELNKHLKRKLANKNLKLEPELDILGKQVAWLSKLDKLNRSI